MLSYGFLEKALEVPIRITYIPMLTRGRSGSQWPDSS
jgi:hypothetical protein